VLSHDRVLGQIFTPESQSIEGDPSVCTRVEFRQSVVAVEEINDLLGVPVKNEHLQKSSSKLHAYFSPDTVMLASFKRLPVHPDMKARIMAGLL
jgi:hypothetical protein